jgi:hypothetical protein
VRLDLRQPWHMPNVQNYPSLASEADDFMTWTPDPELAARAIIGPLTAIMPSPTSAPKSQLVIVTRAMRSLFHTSAYWRTIDDLARGQNNPTFSTECDWWAAVACEASAVR